MFMSILRASTPSASPLMRESKKRPKWVRWFAGRSQSRKRTRSMTKPAMPTVRPSRLREKRIPAEARAR